MVELSVEAELTEVDGFPMEEPLRLHKDLVARYGPTKEAVAALVPSQQILAKLPAMLPLRAFSFFILLVLSVGAAWCLFILFT
jgi:hypothetical protein